MNQESDLSKQAIHLLRSGSSVQEVAVECGRSLKWVYKWQGRYAGAGWPALESAWAQVEQGSRASDSTRAQRTGS